MAEKGKKPKGGRRCVAGAPNKTSCGNNPHTEGITMHQFPTDPVVRAQCVRFVQKHRGDFGEPVNSYTRPCVQLTSRKVVLRVIGQFWRVWPP